MLKKLKAWDSEELSDGEEQTKFNNRIFIPLPVGVLLWKDI